MRFLEVAYIKRIKIWGKVIGIGTILYGIISIILSFFTSFIYIIPALVSILIGKLFYDIGHEANLVLQSDDESISLVQPILHKYSKFLITLGIVIIFTIFCYVAFFIIVYNLF